MLIEVLGHATLALYVITFIASMATAALISVEHYKYNKELINICRLLLVLIMLASLSYSIVQFLWVHNENDAKIFSYETILWTISEWLVAITLLSFTYAIRVFLKWKSVDHIS